MSEFNQAEKINARSERENLVSRDGKYYDSQGKKYNPDVEICDPDVVILEEASPLDNLSNPGSGQPSIGIPVPTLDINNKDDVNYEFFEETGENTGAAVIATHTRVNESGEELVKEEAFLEVETIPIEEATGPYATGYEIEEGHVLRVSEELGNDIVFERKYFTFRWSSFRATADGLEFYIGHLNLVEGYLKHPDLPTVGGSFGLGGFGAKYENGNLQFSNTKGTLSISFQLFKQKSKENHQKKMDSFQSLIDETENRFEKRIPKLSEGRIKG